MGCYTIWLKNPNFLSRWNKILKQAKRGLIKLLREELKNVMHLTETEVKSLLHFNFPADSTIEKKSNRESWWKDQANVRTKEKEIVKVHKKKWKQQN